ncbi:MAG: folate-binding protein YgfZ [Actinomycetota bacterium]
MTISKRFFADRSERGKLRFTGPQRAWFLHQILTQSFEDIQPGEERDAALLTPNGRMIGYLEACATDEAIFCHFEVSLNDTLPDAIRKYVLATDVRIDDVTQEMGLVLVGGPGWRDAELDIDGVHVLQASRAVGVDAAYVWTQRDEVGGLMDRLESRGFEAASEEELEASRIDAGVPRWGFEMNEKTIPQEAGIDDWAVHYSKGCYVGQEAMAKIHFRGKPNRRLAQLQGDSDLQPGADVLVEGKKIGAVTSAAGTKALAIVRYDVEAGAAVQIDDALVQVVA